MEEAALGGAANIGPQYVRFFQTPGVSDGPKVQTLACLLKRFYLMAAHLGKHLAPVGALLHSAVSRMVESENPRARPQHRWIRVVDRLEFFGDSNDHASRLVNVGLSCAYRHQELQFLTSANAVRLKDLRLSVVNGNNPNSADAPLQQPQIGGVIVARQPGQHPTVGDVAGAGGAGPSPAGSPPLVQQPPLGGVVVARRPGAPTTPDHLPGAGTAGALQAGALQASALQAIAPRPPPDGVAQVAMPAGGVVVSRRGSGSVPPTTDTEGVGGLTAAQPSKGAGGIDRLGDVDVVDGGVVVATR